MTETLLDQAELPPDAIAEITRETFGVMLGVELMELFEPPAPLEGPTSMVHITGGYQLIVQLSFSAGFADHAAATMFEMSVDDLDAESRADALGELANMIGGGVKALLPEQCQLSLPMVADDAAAARIPHAEAAESVAFTDGAEQMTVTVWRPLLDPDPAGGTLS
jgi:chemotaxis protein CheX